VGPVCRLGVSLGKNCSLNPPPRDTPNTDMRGLIKCRGLRETGQRESLLEKRSCQWPPNCVKNHHPRATETDHFPGDTWRGKKRTAEKKIKGGKIVLAPAFQRTREQTAEGTKGGGCTQGEEGKGNET